MFVSIAPRSIHQMAPQASTKSTNITNNRAHRRARGDDGASNFGFAEGPRLAFSETISPP